MRKARVALILLAMLPALGCYGTQIRPTESQKAAQRAQERKSMIQYCETRGGFRECWWITQEEMRRILDRYSR